MSRRLPTIHGITEHDVGPYRMERLDLEFSNGERRKYERLHGRGHGAVAVVPMLDADTVLLVREYAAGVHRYELGLVKGRRGFLAHVPRGLAHLREVLALVAVASPAGRARASVRIDASLREDP